MHLMKSRASRLLGLMAVILAVVIAPTAVAQGPAVPNPTVTPVPVRVQPGHPSRDYPWMTTLLSLQEAGYVEEEFFYEGTARRFNTAGDNAMNGRLVSDGHKYKTRMIVRRPRDMRRFNGTVLAEWQNVTAGYDLDAMWGGSFEHITRAGYIWVGISAQRVGVQAEPNGLKVWSPARYGTLDVTDGGKVTDDSLSYDIFAQGVQAIRNPRGVNVLGGATPRTILVIGASQSAGRLGTYINALHNTLGGPIDAYMVFIGGARIRDDLNVPVFKLLSETDVPGQVRNRQPDTERFRHWEVAGASHSSRRTSMNSGPMTRRDGVARTAPECQYPTYPRVPMNYVLSAAYDHMVAWVRDKKAPPIAPRMEIENNAIRRDANGNGLGGIRLAEFDPPTAIQTGVNSGGRFCNLYGRYEPFDDARLASLYPTHKAYVDAANARTAANERSGFILRADANESRKRAAETIYGYGGRCAAACRAAQDLLDASYFYLGLSAREAALTTRLSGVVRTIAENRPGASDRARRELVAWVGELRTMRDRGTLSEAVLLELSTGADAVLKAL
jgi:hypothetical protein